MPNQKFEHGVTRFSEVLLQNEEIIIILLGL
jgi:hypothetical protein